MLRAAYLLLLILLTAWLGLRLGSGQAIETDLTALLPADASLSATEQQAIARNDIALNRQIILLVGADTPQHAMQTAAAIAQQWRDSGLFSTVRESIQPDLAQLENELATLNLALLPETTRQQLMHQPAAFFAQRAAEITNPFAASFIAPDRDWLGFSTQALSALHFSDTIQRDPTSGMLLLHEENMTWVLLNATLPEDNGIINAPPELLPLLHAGENFARSQQAQTLMTGGAIFAAEGRAAGERESRIMSTAGMVLTTLLLLSVFKSLRFLSLFVPLAAGLLMGMAATVAWFGQIHILTLVIGTSLVGVLIDFPLHWLSKAVAPDWRAEPAMRRIVPTFVISLLITVSGYLVLLVTPLPILRQSAIFSATSLFGAFLCTVLILPLFFRTTQVTVSPLFLRGVNALFESCFRLKKSLLRPVVLLSFVLILLFGLWRGNWQDDIRDWISTPQAWLQQALAIGQKTDMMPAGQFLLIEGDDSDALVRTHRQVASALDTLQAAGTLDGYLALNRWIAPQAQQQQTRQALLALSDRPDTWQALRDVGIPDAAIREALHTAAARPLLSLEDSLHTAPAEPYRALWLGTSSSGQALSMVRLFGVHDTAALSAMSEKMPDVHFIDQRARLNHLFHDTRDEAIVLKLASYLFAFVLLAYFFKASGSLKILSVPIFAAAMTLAVLGIIGETVTLFSVFGLLLVTAIGVDYAVYANSAHIGRIEKRCGITLSALTTMISFSLLALSSTPAIAGFGMSVALGVLFNALWTAWLFDTRPIPR
ncbi:MAG: hypothetical protein Q4G42_00515 [Neisseria sp.]|nr:hypothetical protein [Neisseria sp.]